MKIAVLYINVSYGQNSDYYARHFVDTLLQFPGGPGHDTFIICNGGPICPEREAVFLRLPGAALVPRSNEGWDIGGYLEAARSFGQGYDLLACLGESCYFHRPGWLAEIVAAWEKCGPGMYGPFASNTIRSHLNTSAFCIEPKLLADYPWPVSTRTQRYNFEHGEQALWRLVAWLGRPVRLVTWDGVWSPEHWRLPANIMWRGDQSNCLLYCNHTDKYRDAPEQVQNTWKMMCDAAAR